MSYERASAVVAAALWVGSLGGCNTLFGVEAGELRQGDAGAGGQGGGDGTGGQGGTGGTGGTGGQGGGEACGFYDGDGSFTAEAGAGSNLATTSFSGKQSISGQFTGSSQTSDFSIGGSSESYCGLGVHLTIAGLVEAGKTYTPVSRASFEDLATFNQGDNAFVTFGVTDKPCDPGTDRVWDSVDGGAGTVTVDSIVGTRVNVTVTGVTLVANPAEAGAGEMLLSGSFHADCFAY